MLCLPGRRALSWATLLLLLGFQLLLIPAWHFQIGKEGNEESSLALYFPATVEFALHTFNEQSKDKYAYRLDHILNSSREEVSACILSCPVFLHQLLHEGPWVSGFLAWGFGSSDIVHIPFKYNVIYSVSVFYEGFKPIFF
jgi:hypothetical protein